MKIALHSCYEELNINSQILANPNTKIGDDLFKPFMYLKERAEEFGINICTIYNESIENIDGYIFIDEPNYNSDVIKLILSQNKPIFLINLESPIIKKMEDVDSLEIYKVIFTYNDYLIEKFKYKKINYSFDLSKSNRKYDANKIKTYVLLASNKISKMEGELYSLRAKDYLKLKKITKGNIDLYGYGWDRYEFKHYFPYKIFNRFIAFKKIMATLKYSTYKGVVERKYNVLNRYKFAICYENVENIPGYITEKIFDCFLSGCIPIYLGASNIDKYIPEDCFINRSKFESIEDISTYIDRMSENEVKKYVKNIENFLDSSKAKLFTLENFSMTIINEVVKHINAKK